MTICIPEHVAVQLQLTEIDKREVTTADERSHVVPYVGPIQIRFQNRTCFTGALVLGEMVLLGAVPMEDMDLVISPSRQTVVVNPKSPNIPSAVVKATGQPGDRHRTERRLWRNGPRIDLLPIAVAARQEPPPFRKNVRPPTRHPTMTPLSCSAWVRIIPRTFPIFRTLNPGYDIVH